MPRTKKRSKGVGAKQPKNSLRRSKRIQERRNKKELDSLLSGMSSLTITKKAGKKAGKRRRKRTKKVSKIQNLEDLMKSLRL